MDECSAGIDCGSLTAEAATAEIASTANSGEGPQSRRKEGKAKKALGFSWSRFTLVGELCYTPPSCFEIVVAVCSLALAKPLDRQTT